MGASVGQVSSWKGISRNCIHGIEKISILVLVLWLRRVKEFEVFVHPVAAEPITLSDHASKIIYGSLALKSNGEGDLHS